MNEVKTVLDRATADGVITVEQAGRLVSYFAPATASPDEVPDTETPRFIRGFHDVLITIGVAIALTGITGIASVFATLPAIVILAEILVRHQRLALPAVALTIATVVATIMLTVTLMDGPFLDNIAPAPRALVTLAPLAVTLGLFAWRYRVPMALAGLFLTLATMVLAAVFWGLGATFGTDDIFDDRHGLAVAIFFVAALLLFALAMRYDLSDPRRETRRSDIAFWLHLVTAPALLSATLSLFLRGDSVMPFFVSSQTLWQAAGIIIPVVFLLMAIGVIIDRRAFVTSGLVSLIAALVALLRHGQLQADNTIFLALLLVGLLVLTIGVGWRALRRRVIGLLPPSVSVALPPVV
ncbi:MAG: hypothetical protein DI589_07620 [Shinella sp.]|nr:MAG: hypothetical protein DI589_07620 [Shinella sp.]